MVKKKPATSTSATKKPTEKTGTLIASKATGTKPQVKAPMQAPPVRRSKAAAAPTSAQVPAVRRSNAVAPLAQSAHAPAQQRHVSARLQHLFRHVGEY